MQSHAFVNMLRNLGIWEVYVGNHGMKHYVRENQLRSVPDVASDCCALDLGQMCRDPQNLWLFGVQVSNGRGIWKDVTNRKQWRAQALVPGAQVDDNLDKYIYGWLDCHDWNVRFDKKTSWKKRAII